MTATGDPASRVEVDRADELGRVATSFNTMLHALQQSLAAQRQLVSDASHELRTPLTSLRINAELLAGDPGLSGPSARRCWTGSSPRSANSASWWPTSPNWPAASQRSPQRASADVRLDEVVAAGLEGARRDWPQTLFTADLEPCVVFGSAGRLQIAVRNLLDNAAKFGPPGAPVEVRLLAASSPCATTDRYRARRPAACLRPLLPGGVGPGRARLGSRALHRAPGGRKPRRNGPAESAPGGGTLIRLRLPGSASPDSRTPPSALSPEQIGASDRAGPGRECSSRR